MNFRNGACRLARNSDKAFYRGRISVITPGFNRREYHPS